MRVLRPMRVLVCALLAWVGLAGCGEHHLSEDELLSRLQASGLTVERLIDGALTSQQRSRLGGQPGTMLSVRVSDSSGTRQAMTLVRFDKEWKARAALEEGVHGFAVHNWFFVGVVSSGIRHQIEAALL